MWRRQTRSGGSANDAILAAASFRPTSALSVGATNKVNNNVNVNVNMNYNRADNVNNDVNNVAGHRGREVSETRSDEVWSTVRHYGNEQPKRRRGDLPSRVAASSR